MRFEERLGLNGVCRKTNLKLEFKQTEDMKPETNHTAAQTENRKPETRQKSVQTNKTVLDLRFSEEKNCFGPPVQTNTGPYNTPSSNMGPYRAPKTNMGPYPKTYRAPHSRDKL